MKHLIIALLSFSLFIACNSDTKKSADNTAKTEVQEVHVVLKKEDFKKAIANKDIQFVDVRTPEEYEEGHIGNAGNVDYLGDNFEAGIQKYDKSKPIYIYCRSGNRSGKAAKIMKELGFTKIYDLEGGYLGWEE